MQACWLLGGSPKKKLGGCGRRNLSDTLALVFGHSADVLVYNSAQGPIEPLSADSAAVGA